MNTPIKKASISLLCMCFLITQPLFAAKIEEDGWYVGILGGFGFPLSLNSSTVYGTIPDSPPITVSGPLSYKNIGGHAGAQTGYKFGPLRLEGQILWIHAGLKNADLNGIPGNQFRNAEVSGFANTYAGMGNIFYDFVEFADETRETVMVPYIGAGVGYAQLQQRINVEGVGNVCNHRFNVQDSQLAYQVIVGTSLYLDSYTSLIVDYRFFSTTNFDTFNSSFRYHSINFGINFLLDSFFS